MQILAGASEQETILEFASTVEFDSFFADAERDGYFVLNVDALASNCVLVARCVDSPRMRRVRPLSITKIPGGYEIRTSAKSRPELPVEPQRSTETQESPHDRIRALTVTERVTLALKADLLERRILAQENNPKINEFLLRNSRITDQEIAHLARNPASPMQTILAISNHKEWMGRESIRGALLNNPRTPPVMVLDMIPGLSSGELIRMSSSRYLREDVQRAVAQEMKKRGIRPKRLGD